MSNYNIDTGVRFGYISANSLDSDLVHDLMYTYGTDLSYEEYISELKLIHGEDFDEDIASEDYYQDEPIIEGEYEGVKYATSWLGGALNFFIFESPVQSECALCSPCVPGAGDLNTLGNWGNFAYDVPKDWRYENLTQTEKDGIFG